MPFEYDPKKSASNKRKHGIDFVEAQRLWDDPNCVAFPSAEPREQRFILVAELGSKCWSVVYTNRDDVTRIISARRSDRREENEYRKRNKD